MPWESKYRLDVVTGCHVWQRARQSRGYGVVWFESKVHLAHRVAWFQRHGTWPRLLDHRCDNKACVNPAHLQELSNSANIRRAYPRGDAATERRRLRWRKANAQRRNYSADYNLGGE